MSYRNKFLKEGKIFFFDLEFYVPLENRNTKGLKYNPWDVNSKFLGGAFMISNPRKRIKETDISSETETHFLWDYSGEKELVFKFYGILVELLEEIQGKTKNIVSPVLCGIGIISSDIPVLFSLFKKHKIATDKEIFKLQSSFRVIDLSTLAIYSLQHSYPLLYPKSKNEIIEKYFPDKKMQSGMIVWDLYEEQDYLTIINRVKDEIELTFSIDRYLLN